jgi:acyl-CoA synthetase (NDP forming)
MSGIEKIILDEYESKRLIQQYGIRTVEERKITSLDEAVEFTRKTGFPVVLKILSKDVLHKSDVGGVVVGIQNESELENAFDKMSQKFKGKAMLIQRMSKGVEVMVGGKRDDAFGYVILFGLGGIFTEVLEDFSLRVCPITEADAEEMIQEIKGHRILKGYRNMPEVNIQEIKNLLLRVCELMEKERILEIDLNPVMVADNAEVVDALIIKEA